jgi:hypothetical protein
MRNALWFSFPEMDSKTVFRRSNPDVKQNAAPWSPGISARSCMDPISREGAEDNSSPDFCKSRIRSVPRKRATADIRCRKCFTW